MREYKELRLVKVSRIKEKIINSIVYDVEYFAVSEETAENAVSARMLTFTSN